MQGFPKMAKTGQKMVKPVLETNNDGFEIHTRKGSVPFFGSYSRNPLKKQANWISELGDHIIKQITQKEIWKI